MTDSALDRRQMLGAAAMIAAAAPAIASAQPAAPPTPTFTPKPLPFDPKSVPGLSEKLLLSHHDNNYGGTVTRLGAITGQFAATDPATAQGFQLNGLKREELIAWNSMILHELYFAGLAGAVAPSAALAEAIERDFGSQVRWRAEFTAMGKALSGGSGWVLLTWSPHDGRLVNTWAADHTMTLAGGVPILALDMYEHAYQMDYGSNARGYVDAFMKIVSWRNANAVFDRMARR
jgi:Fe-Mn family superoxide dismutase